LHIEFNNNLITIFDDLADLGLLKKLCILSFTGNPILGDKKGRHKLPQLSVLKNLMYHEKYLKFDPVKVHCAGYSVIAKSKNITYE